MVESGAPKFSSLLPEWSPAAGTHAVAADVQGSQAPEIVFTHLWGVSLAPNNGEALGAVVPVGLPDEASLEPGNAFPLDLGDSTAYLKGSRETLRLWRPALDTWKADGVEFPVPGCGVLTELAQGDFNADGLTDVAYIGSSDTDHDAEACSGPLKHGVAVLLQTEVGQLQAMPTLSTGKHKYLRVATGDLDGDGASDIAALTDSDQVLLFRSLTDGAFAPPVAIGDTRRFALADVDGDEVRECVLSAVDYTVSIADHVFGELTLTKMPTLSGIPLGATDLNQDGVDDIAFLWAGVDAPTLALAPSSSGTSMEPPPTTTITDEPTTGDDTTGGDSVCAPGYPLPITQFTMVDEGPETILPSRDCNQLGLVGAGTHQLDPLEDIFQVIIYRPEVPSGGRPDFRLPHVVFSPGAGQYSVNPGNVADSWYQPLLLDSIEFTRALDSEDGGQCL